MGDKALVARWMWNVRVAMYLGFSVPGFLLLVTRNPLMPPFICSIVFAACGVLNLISLFGVLPTEKEWAWLWFTADKKKAEDEGGKYETFVETVCMFPKRFICGAFEKNTLGRFVFLTAYTAINVVLCIEAGNRHANSEKGKALRGEQFLLCGTQNPDVLAGPCADPSDPNGVLAGPIPILQAGLGGVGAGRWYPIAKAFGQLLNLNCAVM